MIRQKEIYWAHITVDIEANTPADSLAFFHQLMQLDMSDGLPHVLKEHDGHGPATEAPAHQHELLREVVVKKVGNRYKAHAIFDLELKHRIVRMVTPWISRFIRRKLEQVEGNPPGSVTLNTSFYCLDFPAKEWEAICSRGRKQEPDATTEDSTEEAA